MPIYEYQCNKCCTTFEEIVFSSDETLPSCPECCNKEVTKLLSAGAIRATGIPSGSGGFAGPACKPSGGG